MKILFYGEYSGLATSLVKGMRVLGYEADVFTNNNGDGFKNIKTDYTLKNKKSMSRFFEYIRLLKVLLSYDKYFIMNSKFLSILDYGPLFLFLLYIFNKKVYLLAAGDDVEYVKCYLNESLTPCPLTHVKKLPERYFQRRRDLIIHAMISKMSKAILPFSFEYKHCWDNSKYRNKVTSVIPLPGFEILDEPIVPVDYNNIKILHGINRPEQKGSKFIQDALNIINSEYGNVSIKIVDRLTLEEYKNELRNTDIVIDQCITNSYGMNAIFSMSYGNVVISGSGDKLKHSLSTNDIPVINANPNVNEIVKLISSLIDGKKIDELKNETLIYGEKIHANIVSAKELLKTINNKV